jgi:ABC-2 type transport system permease protein
VAGILIRMKLRILRNSMTGGKAAWMFIGAVLGLVFAAATFALALARLAAPGLIADLLATTYLIWMLGWLVGPLWGGSAVLRVEHFALLPLPRRKLAFGLLAAAFVGITTAVTALAFLSLVVYGIRLGAGPALVSIPAAAAQLVFVVLLSRVTYAAFGAVAGSRFGAAVTGVLFAAMLVLTQSGWMLIVAVAYSRVLSTGFSSAVSTAVHVLPSGWGVAAVGAAGRGPWGQALGALAGLAALCALLLLGWSRALAGARHTRSVVRGSRRATAPARGLYSGATGAVLRKELRTWTRDPLRITTATVPLAWTLGTALLPLTFATKLLLPWAGPALPLMAVASAYNLYSQDGTALWLTLMTGSQRADVRGRQWAWLLLFGPITVAVSIAFTIWSGYAWAWPWVAALVPALLGGGVGLMSYASVAALVPGPDAHKRPDNPLERADTTAQSNVLFWAALVPAVPAGTAVALGFAFSIPALRWCGVPIGLATGLLAAWWLGRVAVDRLTADGPDLLFRLRSGRAERPGPAGTGANGQALPAVSRRDAVVSLLSWVFGSLTFFPQGLVPLIFLIIGARVRSWFLALYLPHAWSWVCAAAMIATGTVLYSQAIRISVRVGRERREVPPETGVVAADPHGLDPKECESV